jgi:hypothetical protein
LESRPLAAGTSIRTLPSTLKRSARAMGCVWTEPSTNVRFAFALRSFRNLTVVALSVGFVFLIVTV